MKNRSENEPHNPFPLASIILSNNQETSKDSGSRTNVQFHVFQPHEIEAFSHSSLIWLYQTLEWSFREDELFKGVGSHMAENNGYLSQ